MQLYLGWLPILKDFNEGLSKEIAHRAHLEQEIIKFEEEHARLLQDSHERKMEFEMFVAKQEEELKRLGEHMVATAKAKRDQMDNMMKANMRQAKDWRLLIQDSQAFNQLLV